MSVFVIRSKKRLVWYINFLNRDLNIPYRKIAVMQPFFNKASYSQIWNVANGVEKPDILWKKLHDEKRVFEDYRLICEMPDDVILDAFKNRVDAELLLPGERV